MSGSGSGTETAFEPVAFLEEAVRIESHEDVTEIRAFLVDTLESHGVDAEIDGAGNTLAYKESQNPDDGPHVVLNTHVDTVTPHVEYERDDGIIRGRGACDAKGPLAALLAGFLSTEPETGRLTLAITPDEETLSTGAHALVSDVGVDADAGVNDAGVDTDAGVDHAEVDAAGAGTDRTPLDGDAYIVGEPTDLDVCTAAKGRFEGMVHLSGENAHAAEFAGANAVAAAEGALKAIREFDDGADPHAQLGRPKLTPTVVEGGEATNQVPADCAITIDRRSVPPETAEGFRDALESAIREAVPDDVGVDVRLTPRDTPFLEAFATDETHDLVRTLSDTAAASADDASDAVGAGEIRPFSAATEASYFSTAPTVVFGPGVLADDEGAVAHAEREYVRTEQVEIAADAVTGALDELIG